MPDLHVLSFTVPYPPDYGGVIDVFAKIKALHAQGVRVHLHCFTYDRGPAPELEAYCASVHYYPRRMWSWRPGMPYIVSSRRSQELLRVLDRDDYPVLSEGIHTSWALTLGRWPGRRVAIRLHNIESEYYRHLSGGWKTPYFLLESALLRRWERRVADVPLLAISPRDAARLHVPYLPAFTNYQVGNNPTGRGDYVLVHGDFTVQDNVDSLNWLMKHVRTPDIPWIAAGRGLTDPDEAQMEELIRNAHMHVVHSFNPSGIKIKLLHALFAGRHCVASEVLTMGLEGTCISAVSAADFRAQIATCWEKPFTEENKSRRVQSLRGQFDNAINARKLMEWMGL